ncbi:hypothetical protein ACEPPN_003784 [Leptodophora sp. 'Broadleaf-Isolate-01']
MTMCNWTSNVVISSTFLTQIQNNGPTATYGFYGGVNFISLITMFFIYPETQGMQLEEIRGIFDKNFGVKKADEWQEEKRLERRNACMV